MPVRPGGELASRPLHFIWIADCSGSMSVDGKIQSLNTAIRDAVPHMQAVADENPNAEVLVRAVKFSSGAQWHISQPTPVADFKWEDLNADGLTDMGKALKLVADQLKIPPMTDRALPPVLVMISDGHPTDDFGNGIQTLMDLPVAIGRDADHDVLQKFIGHPELKPLQANNADQLVKYIKWVSTAVLKAASSPESQAGQALAVKGNVPIPNLPEDSGPASPQDVW